MVSFGKNKDDKGTEKPRYRYDLPPEGSEGITDVLLTEEQAPPLVAALVEADSSKDDEVIYELVIDVKENSSDSPAADTPPNQASNEVLETPDLNAQVTKLCNEYAAINQQLEKSLMASNDLTKQLEKSKKVVTASYVALGVAGLACLLGIGTFVTGINMQRDVEDLKEMLATENTKILTLKQEAASKNQTLDGQIVQMNEKVDKIFASNDLGSVLQVTQELKKQVSALASKNLAAMASRNHQENHPPKESKISLPSLKVKSAEEPVSDKKTPANQSAKEPVPVAKTDTEKKSQNAKPSATDDETAAVKPKKHRWHPVIKKLKAQNPPEHVEKAAKPSPPELPKL